MGGNVMPDSRIDLARPEFPRSSRYDASWMIGNQMGPNALWLLEWLCERLPLAPGMRVLDLGCGKAMTSVFLAKEFGLNVHAVDLWMDPDASWRRVVAAGAADHVCPMRAEAHALAFAAGYFDAVVSVDAYQYFGTDLLYLDYLARFLRPGGLLGIVVPGLVRPLSDGVPRWLTEPQSNGKTFWEESCRSFLTGEAWREIWGGCSSVTGVRVDLQPEGWRHWADFERAVEASGKGIFPSDAEALEKDAGRTIGFVRLLAERTGVTSENLYDPALGMKAGAEG
jgi:SAM-dependent methyltransferase